MRPSQQSQLPEISNVDRSSHWDPLVATASEPEQIQIAAEKHGRLVLAISRNFKVATANIT